MRFTPSSLTLDLGCSDCLGIRFTDDLCRFCVLSLDREIDGVNQHTLKLAVHSDKGYFTVTTMALTSIKQKVLRKMKKKQIRYPLALIEFSLYSWLFWTQQHHWLTIRSCLLLNFGPFWLCLFTLRLDPWVKVKLWSSCYFQALCCPVWTKRHT